ncbi:MAG: hypothetical protein KAT65_22290, partial [Methanophagales archaeon]|nr:hypothetical protein [Methanophagales archaeon]
KKGLIQNSQKRFLVKVFTEGKKVVDKVFKTFERKVSYHLYRSSAISSITSLRVRSFYVASNSCRQIQHFHARNPSDSLMIKTVYLVILALKCHFESPKKV